MAITDVWQDVWEDVWQDIWGGAAAAQTDTHDGGWEWEATDQIRKRLKAAEESQELSRRKRREAEKRLSDELDRAYRKLVLNEPDIAAEVAAVVAPRNEETEPAPSVDFRSLTNLIEATETILAIIERDKLNALAEEDDVEVILLAAV